MNRYCEFSDADLIGLYTSGDNEAFTALVLRHEAKIFTVIMLLVKERTLAEDIFQEVFIKVVNALRSGRYSENCRFVAWVSRIAHNTCCSYFRKIRVRPAIKLFENFDIIYDDTDQIEPSIEQYLITCEQSREICYMLNELSASQREVVILRFYAGLSYKEIAFETKVNINTALGRGRYAVENLRKIKKRIDSRMCME